LSICKSQKENTKKRNQYFFKVFSHSQPLNSWNKKEENQVSFYNFVEYFFVPFKSMYRMFLADKQKMRKFAELRLFTNIAEATALTSWNNGALSRRKDCPKLGRAINTCCSDKKSGEIV